MCPLKLDHLARAGATTTGILTDIVAPNLPDREDVRVPAIPLTTTAEPDNDRERMRTLFHYTNLSGFNGINQSQQLNPSLGPGDANYGQGVYLTDISPEVIAAGEITRGQASRRLFGVPWNLKKFDYFFEINVNGLPVQNPAPHIYLVPGRSPLNLIDRIVRAGNVPK